MTAEQQKNLDELFTRYGNPSTEAEFRITGYYTKANAIDELDRIRRADENAQRDIEQMQEKIRKLSAYRVSLAERYNFLSTAPTVPVVRLIRRKDSYNNKVFYYLKTFNRNLLDGHEVQTGCTTYPGTDRLKAIDDFNQYVKSHPGIEAEKQIEKPKWER